MALVLVYLAVFATSVPTTALGLHIERATQRPDGVECECLKWMDTYKAKKVTCGEYAELGYITKGRRDLSLQEIGQWYDNSTVVINAFCAGQTEKFNHNYCINVDDRNLSAGSWCYVNSACTNLNGGTPIADKFNATTGEVIPRNISAKICTRRKEGVQGDELWRDVSPDRLMYYSNQKGLNFGMIALTAYEKIPPTTAMWSDLRASWTNGDTTDFPDEILEAMNHLRPIIIFSEKDYYNHFKILWGSLLIHVDRDKDTCPSTQFCYEEAKIPQQLMHLSPPEGRMPVEKPHTLHSADY